MSVFEFPLYGSYLLYTDYGPHSSVSVTHHGGIYIIKLVKLNKHSIIIIYVNTYIHLTKHTISNIHTFIHIHTHGYDNTYIHALSSVIHIHIAIHMRTQTLYYHIDTCAHIRVILSFLFLWPPPL